MTVATHNLTASNAGHLQGLFQLSATAPDSLCDMMSGGSLGTGGAGFIPFQVVWPWSFRRAHSDLEWRLLWSLSWELSPGSGGTRKLVGGIEVLQAFAPVSWLNQQDTEAEAPKPVFFVALDAIAVGVATLSRVSTLVRALAATAAGVAALSRVATLARTMAATAIGVAALTRRQSVTFAATAAGVAALSTALTLVRTIAATAVGVAALSRASTFLVGLVATAVGLAQTSLQRIGSGGGEQLATFFVGLPPGDAMGLFWGHR